MVSISNIRFEKAVKKQSKSKINSLLSKEIHFGRYRLKDNKKEEFYGEISILFASGIDMRTALSIISNQQKKKKDKELFTNMLNLVTSGESLSDSMKTLGEFSKYEEFSVRIGEETGRLVSVLEELCTYYNEKITQKRKLTSALSYPAMVMITAVFVIIFMMNFIVPMFQGIFSRFGQDLPMLTRWVLDASEGFNNNFGKILIVIFSLIGINAFCRKKLFYRKYLSALVLRLSLIGNIVRTIYLRQFCQSMSLLLSSGIPLLRALELSKKMIHYYPLEAALEKTAEDILHGSSLHQSLSENSLFDEKIIALIKLGEEVNKLPTIFLQLKNQYSEELRHKTSILNSVLEPILIIFIGGLVAVILIAMYLPMFSMQSVMV
jgi:type IV pilus assembly protein PilC